MQPVIVVLTDFSPAAGRARAYAAALAAPLGASLHLVKVHLPAPVNPEVGRLLYATTARHLRAERHALEQLAAGLPGPATAELAETNWDEAVREALDHYRPLLLVAGLTATDGLLDEWLSNRTLPLAHDTGYPLLLVPQHLPDTALHLPQHLLLAVANQPFELAAHAHALGPLLDALDIEVTVLTVLPADADTGPAGQQGLRAARACGLGAALAGSRAHTLFRGHDFSGDASLGIQRAAAETGADLVALLDAGHGWVHAFFSGSVIHQVLHDTTVPVLLLPARLLPPED